jgi:hypothetical protein
MLIDIGAYGKDSDSGVYIIQKYTIVLKKEH